MSVQIICDSACDLSEATLSEYGVDRVSLKVLLKGKEHEDGQDLSPKEVYDAMRNGEAPKTSQVTAQDFRELFTEKIAADQPFLYIAFSSALSGTYQSAKVVEQELKEEYPKAKFAVIDTKAASLGYGLIVLRAAEESRKNATLRELISLVSYHSKHMEHLFTVDDLAYLQRGGRVTKAEAFVGSLLKIKPLLHVDDGNLVPLEKIRGQKKVFKRMIELMEERGKDLKRQRIAISHGDSEERAKQLASMIEERFSPADIHIDMVGAAIGAHAGPGTIALFFINEEYR
ncbi:DegV family protein [Salimicrobium humidisoli]|uniref:Fatty acid-binding protein DegV n=1 Tax=Salimicrobium humidisoli TaxID=2029857 RepID=A0ABX4HSA5_9BACI|nr:DegV family protein [Salimicrobium humidisoli]PBB06106.1 fatty acid-binding protein DegV [Salimicrobium humidisoli]